ncbi:MAG: type II secretion system F family protein [Lachnospiraceae bacterium]|nr:type II secretion system F family protein [Lachnospiraceae bacterium]
MANQKKLSNAELATFFGQMAMLLDGGIYYREGIETMLKDTKSPSARACLEQIVAELTEHGQFDVALEKTGAFPEHVIRMVRLGLRAGDDKAICHSLADYYDRQEAISEGIKNAVTYPMIMIFMMLLVIIVLITKVLPIFNQVFTQLGSQMNAFSLSLMNFGNRLSSSSIVLVIILCVIIVAYIFFAKVPAGRKLFARFIDVFPPTRKFNDAVACSRFASGIAMVYGRMDTYEGFDLVAGLIDNARMSSKIAKCKELLLEGREYAEALKEAEIFSSIQSRMASIGFKSGNPQEAMNRIADDYDKEVDKRIHDIIAVLEPTLVIILSLIVGMILLSVILPLMGIMSSIG